MTQRRMVEIRFALIEQDEFLALAESAGFTLCAVYGDYDKAPFDVGTSPFIIGVMETTGK